VKTSSYVTQTNAQHINTVRVRYAYMITTAAATAAFDNLLFAIIAVAAKTNSKCN